MTGDSDQLKLILGPRGVWKGLGATILVSVHAVAAPGNEAPRGPEPASAEPLASGADAGLAEIPELGGVREWLANSPDAPRCALAQLLFFSGRVYAACASDGLLVIAPGTPPQVVEKRELGGAVVELLEGDGELRARVQSTTTVVVVASEGSGPAPRQRGGSPPDDSAASAPPKRSPLEQHPEWSRVVQQDADTVIVGLGSDDKLQVGQRLEFLRTDSNGTPFEQLAVGEVRIVGKYRSRVQLGQNEDVPIGSFAQVTPLPPSSSRTTPPRARALTSASLLLRPFLGLDRSSGGIVVDASVSRRLSSPFRISATIAPFGYGAEGGRSAVTFTGFALASYDSQLFEAGTGLGVQTVHSSYYDPGTGTLVPLFVRLGASDGLCLSGRIDLTLFHQSFVATGARVEFVFPVAQGNWLLLNGAGGLSGSTLGELGLRAQVGGNGNAGSQFLTVVVGGSEVSSRSCNRFPSGTTCVEQPNASGAHFGAGFETRF